MEWLHLSKVQCDSLARHIDPAGTGVCNWHTFFLALALPGLPPSAKDVHAAATAWAKDGGGIVSRATFMATPLWFEAKDPPAAPPAHLAERLAEMGFAVEPEAYRLREAALKELLFDFLACQCGGYSPNADPASAAQSVPVLPSALCLCADPDVAAGVAKAAAVVTGDPSGASPVTVADLYTILHRGTAAPASDGLPSAAGVGGADGYDNKAATLATKEAAEAALKGGVDNNSMEQLRHLVSKTNGRPNKPLPVALVTAKQLSMCPDTHALAGWSDYYLPDPTLALQSAHMSADGDDHGDSVGGLGHSTGGAN